MDDPVMPPEKYDAIISQIERVNRLTGGYRPPINWLKEQLSLMQGARSFTIADLGCGRGSLLRLIAKHFHEPDINLIGLDINPLAIEAARKATAEKAAIEYHQMNILSSDDLPAADFVVCSHTTHHMEDKEIITLLRLLDRKAKLGWFICDLHRHEIAHIFARGILSLLPVDPMVAHDGPLSVRRAFKRAEWQKLIEEAGLPDPVRIEWHFPFRYGLSAQRGWHEKI